MKKSVFWLAGWLLLLTGCTGKKASVTPELFATLPQYELQGKKLGMNVLEASRFVFNEDYLVCGNRRASDYLYTVYRRNDPKHPIPFIRKGKGRGEYLYSSDCQLTDNDDFYFYTTNGINKLIICDLNRLTDTIDYPIKEIVDWDSTGSWNSFQHPVIIKDRFVFGRYAGIDMNGEFLCYDLKEGKRIYSEKLPENNFGLNEVMQHSLYQGPISVNGRGDRLFSTMVNGDVVGFYRLEEGKAVPVKVYDFIYPVCRPVEGGKKYLSRDDSYRGGQHIFWSEGKVYLVYCGTDYKTWKERGYKFAMRDVYVFDGEGTPLYSLRLDQPLEYVHVHGNRLIGYRTDDTGYVFYEYTLPKTA